MIYIDNRQDKIEVNDELKTIIEQVIEYTLKEENVNVDFEVSVIFIDNEEIRGINSEQRNIDKVTDVLSFPMLDYPKGKVYKDIYLEYEFKPIDLDEGRIVLGDVVLSLEIAKEQSVEYGHSFIRECAYLTVHSILHLLGYDHMEEEEKKKMREREEDILNKFHISR